jgi:hypothetical protein
MVWKPFDIEFNLADNELFAVPCITHRRPYCPLLRTTYVGVLKIVY